MSKSVFLDTSGWLALVTTRDKLHSAANVLWRRLGRERSRVLLTDWVVAEVGNSLSKGPARTVFDRSLQQLRSDPSTTIQNIDAFLLDEALELFRERIDKTWGLVDCASFVVMQKAGIQEAFTADQHFVQAGFTKLL